MVPESGKGLIRLGRMNVILMTHESRVHRRRAKGPDQGGHSRTAQPQGPSLLASQRSLVLCSPVPAVPPASDTTAAANDKPSLTPARQT